MKQPTKSALPPAARHLVEIMQRLVYGRIAGLLVRDGLPVFDPKPRIIPKFLCSAAPSARSPDHRAADFNLKPEVTSLFQKFALIGNGVIESLVVQNGLPVWFEMEE